MKQLSDLEVSGKRVFVRADLDVPMDSGSGEGATRLHNLKSTVDYLLEKSAKQIIIAGHIGRPEGRDLKFSTKPLLGSLEKILGMEIVFYDELAEISEEKLILLENLRFWDGESKNEQEFAKQLAGVADCYINEAFGNSHREHASMVALPKLLPHAAGLHLEEEVRVLSEVLSNPKRPLVAAVGGAKLETKIPVIHNLSSHADQVIVGGELPVEIAKQRLVMPENVFVSVLTHDNFDVSEDSMIQISKIIEEAKSIVWNGPFGLYEEGHEKSTLHLANMIIDSGAYSIVGGGETTQFLAGKNLLSKFSFVSSGGGAMLEFLAGKVLPGLKALE